MSGSSSNSASGSSTSPAAGAVSSHSTSGASSAGPAPGAAQGAGSTISLGNVGSYSGVIGAVFAGAEPALGVWENYVNAHGGLNGHPVHIYFGDDGGDPSTSVSVVEKEVTQDHVIAFVGNFYPLTVSASEPYLLQQDIPVIGGDSNANEWWQSPVLFPQGSGALNPSIEAEFTIGAAVARGYSKMAVLYCVEDSGCGTTVSSFEKPGSTVDGATTVYSSSISLTQPDFTAQCLAAKQAGATFVYFAGDSDSLNRMVGDCVAQGYNPIYDIDSLAVTSDLISDPHLDGLLAGQSDFPWVDSFTPAQTTYQQAMKTYAPSLQGSASHGGGVDGRHVGGRGGQGHHVHAHLGGVLRRPLEHQGRQSGGTCPSSDVHAERARDAFVLLLPDDDSKPAIRGPEQRQFPMCLVKSRAQDQRRQT